MSDDDAGRIDLNQLREDVLRRLGSDVPDKVRSQLLRGQLDKLLEVGRALQEHPSVLTSIAVNPQIRMDALPKIKATSGLVVTPKVKVDATTVVPPELMQKIRSAVPDLASDIDGASAKDVTAYLALLTALLQLITALVTIYQIAHQQPPTPAQITQVFDNSIHQTIVVNPPPPPPSGTPPR